MTAKRDFKRRVRERQARTGERYTTARRHTLAARASDLPTAVPVVQLHDVSGEAARLGFRCQIAMAPALSERAATAAVLTGLRDALIATPGNSDAVQLFGIAFGLPSGAGPELHRQAPVVSTNQVTLRFVGPPARSGVTMVFGVAGRDGIVPVVCADCRTGLVLSLVDGRTEVDIPGFELALDVADRLRREAALGRVSRPPIALAVGDPVRVTHGPLARLSGKVEEVIADKHKVVISLALAGGTTSVVLDAGRVEKRAAALFVIYDGRGHRVTNSRFIIGGDRATCDLAIKGGRIARAHAAVIHRSGVYYLKDLGSSTGIEYRGMRIDSKRIDDDDAFQLGGHELRFAYRLDD
jgi:hypothetical protein